jgi:hypothetical protein
MARRRVGSLEQLQASLADAKVSTRYTETGQLPWPLTSQQTCQYDGQSEVEAVAVERDPERRVVRALVWHGTSRGEPWEIRVIHSKDDAECCGIVDHNWPA